MRLLSDVLEAQGYHVHHTMSGAEGLELAWRAMPDLVLMDVQMPVMSGTEAMKRLKADPRSRDIPVLAVTALAMAGDEEALLEEGFDSYLSKPVAFKAILQAVRTHLKAAHGRDVTRLPARDPGLGYTGPC